MGSSSSLALSSNISGIDTSHQSSDAGSISKTRDSARVSSVEIETDYSFGGSDTEEDNQSEIGSQAPVDVVDVPRDTTQKGIGRV